LQKTRVPFCPALNSQGLVTALFTVLAVGVKLVEHLLESPAGIDACPTRHGGNPTWVAPYKGTGSKMKKTGRVCTWTGPSRICRSGNGSQRPNCTAWDEGGRGQMCRRAWWGIRPV